MGRKKKHYKRLTLDERVTIEEGLDKGLSLRKIAALISRSASTVSDEIKENRSYKTHKVYRSSCKELKDCIIKGLCKECKTPSKICCRCKEVTCTDICEYYFELYHCEKLTRAPWVCNGCKRNGRRCSRPRHMTYVASIADKSAKERRSSARLGINATEETFDTVMGIVRPALARKLSPYEIATLYKDVLPLSASTIYRWIDKGYGGMANIELERKVGFAPRKAKRESCSTHHGKMRSYKAFLELTQDEQGGAVEMDSVLGKKTDRACILSLYIRPAHFQLFFLLEEKTVEEVVRIFDLIESINPKLFREIFSVVLTDNGSEFEDPAALEKSHATTTSKRCRIFYCDPRRSDQKARCEKNHSELRQLLPKGQTHMDNLTVTDMAYINSMINSTPRKSLCGLSPIEMLMRAYGELAETLLDAFSIGHVSADELNLMALDTKPTEEDKNATTL